MIQRYLLEHLPADAAADAAADAGASHSPNRLAR